MLNEDKYTKKYSEMLSEDVSVKSIKIDGIESGGDSKFAKQFRNKKYSNLKSFIKDMEKINNETKNALGAIKVSYTIITKKGVKHSDSPVLNGNAKEFKEYVDSIETEIEKQ